MFSLFDLFLPFYFFTILPFKFCFAKVSILLGKNAYSSFFNNQISIQKSSMTNIGMVTTEARVVTNVTSVIMVVSLPYFRQRMVP